MAKKVLVNLDMNGNEIQNVVMQVLAAAPSNPKMGQYYYNSASKKAFQWDGSAWKPLGGAEITVDSALSGTSTNPVQNKAIKTELDKKVEKVDGKGLSTNDFTDAAKQQLANLVAGTITVDSALSSTSENPVQNKVIEAALSDKAESSIAVAAGTFEVSQSSATGGVRVDYTTVDAGSSGDFTILAAKDSLYGVVKLDSSVTASGANPVTGKAIYDYVGDAIAASDAMVFKGTIGTGGTVTTLPTTYKTGWTYRVITAGTYAGQNCEVGDLIIALVDRNGTGNLDSDWTVAQTNIDGAITDIKGDTPILIDGSGASRTISHADSSVTPGQYGETSNKTLTFGGTFSMPYVGADKTGHFTGGTGQVTITLPNNVATTDAPGLMSAQDKKDLNNAFRSIPQVVRGTISKGQTSITLEPTGVIISTQAYVGAEEVIVDVNADEIGDTVVSIAKPYTSDIDVVMICADI